MFETAAVLVEGEALSRRWWTSKKLASGRLLRLRLHGMTMKRSCDSVYDD